MNFIHWQNLEIRSEGERTDAWQMFTSLATTCVKSLHYLTIIKGINKWTKWSPSVSSYNWIQETLLFFTWPNIKYYKTSPWSLIQWWSTPRWTLFLDTILFFFKDLISTSEPLFQALFVQNLSCEMTQQQSDWRDKEKREGAFRRWQ